MMQLYSSHGFMLVSFIEVHRQYWPKCGVM